MLAEEEWFTDGDSFMRQEKRLVIVKKIPRCKLTEARRN